MALSRILETNEKNSQVAIVYAAVLRKINRNEFPNKTVLFNKYGDFHIENNENL